MFGAANKTSALAAMLALSIGLALGFHPPSILAQDETVPETAPTEAPKAEPTYSSPITAGDAERGAPAPSIAPTPEAIGTGSPTEAPSLEANPSPAHPGGATSTKASNSAKGAGGAGAIVPDNSPFASMNFANSKAPTNINSDAMNLDYKDKAILFTGHVHAVQGAGDLTSDILRVQYGKDFNDIQMMYADGNVRMSQGTRWITSDHAILDQSKHLLTFHGNPVAHDGKDQITGSVIAVDLVTGKSTVQKPRVIIFPRETKNPDNGGATDNP